MKVIALHEPPRGAWCGSLFHVEDDGRLTASVLIRTASFERFGDRWRFRTLAGAGIVADSDPAYEAAECRHKASALIAAAREAARVAGGARRARGLRGQPGGGSRNCKAPGVHLRGSAGGEPAG